MYGAVKIVFFSICIKQDNVFQAYYTVYETANIYVLTVVSLEAN